MSFAYCPKCHLFYFENIAESFSRFRIELDFVTGATAVIPLHMQPIEPIEKPELCFNVAVWLCVCVLR